MIFLDHTFQMSFKVVGSYWYWISCNYNLFYSNSYSFKKIFSKRIWEKKTRM